MERSIPPLYQLLFCLLSTNTLQKGFKRGKVYFGSQFEGDSVHCGREDTVVAAKGIAFMFYVHKGERRKKRERKDEFQCSASFFPFSPRL